MATRSPFPPVSLDGNDPWYSPQYIPGNPSRLPGRSQRPAPPARTLVGETGDDRQGSGIADGGIVPNMPAGRTPSIRRGDSGLVFLTPGNLELPVALKSYQFIPLAENERNFLMMRNNGASNIFIEFGRDASIYSVIRLSPNQIVTFDLRVPQDDVYALSDVVGGALSYSFSQVT